MITIMSGRFVVWSKVTGGKSRTWEHRVLEFSPVRILKLLIIMTVIEVNKEI